MIVSTNIVPDGFDALTVWPFILVRNECVADKGLIAHEMVHYKEQKAAWVIPWLWKYWRNKQFRLEAEVRGYKAQLAINAIPLERASFLLTQYGVNLSQEQATKLLTT